MLVVGVMGAHELGNREMVVLPRQEVRLRRGCRGRVFWQFFCRGKRHDRNRIIEGKSWRARRVVVWGSSMVMACALSKGKYSFSEGNMTRHMYIAG